MNGRFPQSQTGGNAPIPFSDGPSFAQADILPVPTVDRTLPQRLPEDAHVDILAAMQDWSGFRTLDAAMRAYPRTEVFIAGGVMRDYFKTGRCVPKDFDLFLGGQEVDEFLSRLADDGAMSVGPFGSPRWRPSGLGGCHADLVPIDRFNNGLWQCRDVLDALNQFDFTANAIALDMRLPRLFDPQNGVLDARSRTMRAVRFDYPDEPISPGSALSRLGVLWIRLVHYASTLGFDIEPITYKWLCDHAQLGMQVRAFSEIFFPVDLRLRPPS